MKKPTLLTIVAVTIALVTSASAATLVNTNYTTNTTSTDDQGFVQSGTTTWNITVGVTVEAATGRFFIGEQTAPNTTDAIFVITGGGTLLISNSNAFTMRLDQNGSTENGILRIEGGSLVNFTGNQGPFLGAIGSSSIILSGIGSTLMAEGTYDLITGTYNRGANAAEALPVSALGGTLSSSYNAATNVTTLSVIPEPSAALLGGLGMIAMFRRRR